MNPLATPSSMTSTLKLFTFCFYIGKNTYQELVLMLYVLLASLDRFHPDFFLVVYHNLGIVIDDPRVRMVDGFGGGAEWGVKGGYDERLLLDADGCEGNVWVEGSAVRNRWYKLSFNKIHVFKNLYDEYGGECFTWIDLDTVVVADLSYLNAVDNYFVMHGGSGGGGGERMHDVLLGCGGDVLWSVPEALYIHGSFWKLNLSLYHEVLRLDSLFRENGVRLKYDVQSIFAVMARGGGGDGYGCCPFYDGHSRATTGSMLVIGDNFMPYVMNGLGVWDTKNALGNHVNTESLANFWWGGPPGVPPGVPPPNGGPERTIVSEAPVDIDRRLKLTEDCTRCCAERGAALARSRGVAEDCFAETNGSTNGSTSDRATERLSMIFRTSLYPDKEIHILSLTFDSFFMSNVSESSDFARLFPFLLV